MSNVASYLGDTLEGHRMFFSNRLMACKTSRTGELKLSYLTVSAICNIGLRIYPIKPETSLDETHETCAKEQTDAASCKKMK